MDHLKGMIGTTEGGMEARGKTEEVTIEAMEEVEIDMVSTNNDIFCFNNKAILINLLQEGTGIILHQVEGIVTCHLPTRE